MFYCPITKRCTKPRDKMVKIVVETRPKTYYKRVRNVETGEIEDVAIGSGFEIVKELGVSEEGERQWKLAHSEAKEQKDVV